MYINTSVFRLIIYKYQGFHLWRSKVFHSRFWFQIMFTPFPWVCAHINYRIFKTIQTHWFFFCSSYIATNTILHLSGRFVVCKYFCRKFLFACVFIWCIQYFSLNPGPFWYPKAVCMCWKCSRSTWSFQWWFRWATENSCCRKQIITTALLSFRKCNHYRNLMLIVGHGRKQI